MGEDRHQQQVNNHDSDQEVAGKRLTGGVQLVAGAGNRNIHRRGQHAFLAQPLQHRLGLLDARL